MIKRYAKLAKDISLGDIDLSKDQIVEVINEVPSKQHASGTAIVIRTDKDAIVVFDASFFEQ